MATYSDFSPEQQNLDPTVLFDEKFALLKSVDKKEPRSSFDTIDFLTKCDELVAMARQTEDTERLKDALFFTLRVANSDMSYKKMALTATELIKGGFDTETRARGYYARYLANNRLAGMSHGQKRRDFLIRARDDCGAMILAVRSIEEPGESAQDLVDALPAYQQEYESILAQLEKKTLLQRIGTLATR